MSFIFLPRSPSPDRSLSARHKKTSSFTKSPLNSDKKKANTILTSWIRNEREAEEIRAKFGKEKNFFFSKDPNSKTKDEISKNMKKNEFFNQKKPEAKKNRDPFEFNNNKGKMGGLNGGVHGMNKSDSADLKKNECWVEGGRNNENYINSSRNNENFGQEKSTKNQEIKAFVFENESESKIERNSNASFQTLDERKSNANTNNDHISKVYSIKNKTKVINSSKLLFSSSFSSSPSSSFDFISNINFLLEALTRTSDEMSLLKEKRRDLEKQAILLEKETLNRNKERSSKKKRTENILTNLKNEHEKSKLDYNKYRSEKMEGKLGVLWKKNRKTKLTEFFELIRRKWKDEQNKIKQVIIFYFFSP